MGTTTVRTVKKKNQSLEERKASQVKLTQEREIIKMVVFDLWLKAYSYRAIQQALEEEGHTTSVTTISKYIKAILEQHKNERLEQLDDYKRLELLKLDKLEATYWDGYEKSIGIIASRSTGGWEKVESPGAPGITALEVDLKENKVLSGGAGARAAAKNKKYVTVTETPSLGDVRYLMGVERCIDKRCKILGLDSPIVIEDKTKTKVKRVINISVHGK